MASRAVVTGIIPDGGPPEKFGKPRFNALRSYDFLWTRLENYGAVKAQDFLGDWLTAAKAKSYDRMSKRRPAR
jgi:hypothetical protein